MIPIVSRGTPAATIPSTIARITFASVRFTMRPCWSRFFDGRTPPPAPPPAPAPAPAPAPSARLEGRSEGTVRPRRVSSSAYTKEDRAEEEEEDEEEEEEEEQEDEEEVEEPSKASVSINTTRLLGSIISQTHPAIDEDEDKDEDVVGKEDEDVVVVAPFPRHAAPRAFHPGARSSRLWATASLPHRSLPEYLEK